MNQPNKLDCYITVGCKCLPVTNSLTYWACSQVTNKMKFCEYVPWLVYNSIWYSIGGAVTPPILLADWVG